VVKTVGSMPLRSRSGAVIALALVLAGCGAATHKTAMHRPAKNVTPRAVERTFRGVERAFPALHFRLVDSGFYTNVDTPIIREYALNVSRGDISVGTLFVYATAKEAAADQSSAPSPSRLIRRANLVTQFDSGTPRIIRSIITAALSVAATGSGRINGHSLSA